MAAPSNKPQQASRSLTSPAPPNNASARLEKTHPGIRRSTPDSEALASSDDDGEHQPHTFISPNIPAQKPARRTSWLNEIPAIMPRKASLTGPLSSGASNPTSPATDQTGWQTTTSPALSNSITWNNVPNNSFTWGTGIWNTESRKEPPLRLSELVPSPTMSNPSTASNYLTEEMLSPTTRTTSGDSAIPFSIPLHPTPKTYRSQSYSVGQMDPEYLPLTANKPAASYSGARPRNGAQYSALQHRSSRPSLLGELGHDPATLGRVREADDDEATSPNGSDGSYSNYNANQARTIEHLSRENAYLRQQAGHMENPFRERTMSSASAASGYAVGTGIRNMHRIRGSVPEETDLAVEDLDEVGDIPGYNNIYNNNPRRRFSEHSVNLEKQFPAFTPLQDHTLENVRKGQWQTSLGFGALGDIPQSRRHSFAEIPIRNPSISGDTQVAGGTRVGLGEQEETYANITEASVPSAPGPNREYQRFHMAPRPEEHEMETEYLRARRFAESYFTRDPSIRSAADAQSPIPTSLHQAYTSYGRHQHGLSHPHQSQLLYIVTFKCHRADVFYIQEDTGLQVKPGDLVIVEADRGTDLGTIQHANISLQKARELKQKYAEEHYKWLMMFSRQGQNGSANVVGTPGNVPGLNTRSAIGGMGPHGPHGLQESSDIKPKLIKRLAQNHEILTLRDKEGNEAKAKRVCQQKVAEHRLNMEILDAEFQMDWKKLTFYYFADSYINFNSLVTDLFKIYKTRIWMSAINPASFVTPPSAGLQGPNPLGYSQDAQGDRSHQRDTRTYGQTRDGVDVGRDGAGNQMAMLRSGYGDSYQGYGHTLRQTEPNLGGIGSIDPFATHQANAYGPVESGYSDYTTPTGTNNGPSHIQPAPSEWVNRFQGLSLNS